MWTLIHMKTPRRPSTSSPRRSTRPGSASRGWSEPVYAPTGLHTQLHTHPLASHWSVPFRLWAEEDRFMLVRITIKCAIGDDLFSFRTYSCREPPQLLYTHTHTRGRLFPFVSHCHFLCTDCRNIKDFTSGLENKRKWKAFLEGERISLSWTNQRRSNNAAV